MTGTPPNTGEQNGSSSPINLRVEVKSPEAPAPLDPHPLPDPELCDRLVAAVQQAALDSSHSMEALRLAVCDFTSALRQQGTTPEGVLISLKSVVNHRAAPTASESFFFDRTDPAIQEKMSTWSIQEFFRGMEAS